VTRNGRLHLTKHHGAGNDFLVLLDRSAERPLGAAEAAVLCDRHRGVGADGVIRAIPSPGGSGAALCMELTNADGSVAEMSGNGIRCLVQAAVGAGWVSPGVVEVDTLAGRRRVDYRPGAAPAEGFATVDMGEVTVLGEVPLDLPPAAQAAMRLSVGNPHLVLLFGQPVDDELVAGAGRRLEGSVDGGTNVEFLWPLGAGSPELALRVWERGVGETLACGTGTCAAAAAARRWGLGERRLRVHNPGGVLEVELTDDGVLLGGPTVQVAAVEVDEEVLASLVAAEPATTGRELAVAQAQQMVDEVAAGR